MTRQIYSFWWDEIPQSEFLVSSFPLPAAQPGIWVTPWICSFWSDETPQWQFLVFHPFPFPVARLGSKLHLKYVYSDQMKPHSGSLLSPILPAPCSRRGVVLSPRSCPGSAGCPVAVPVSTTPSARNSWAAAAVSATLTSAVSAWALQGHTACHTRCHPRHASPPSPCQNAQGQLYIGKS